MSGLLPTPTAAYGRITLVVQRYWLFIAFLVSPVLIYKIPAVYDAGLLQAVYLEVATLAGLLAITAWRGRFVLPRAAWFLALLALLAWMAVSTWSIATFRLLAIEGLLRWLSLTAGALLVAQIFWRRPAQMMEAVSLAAGLIAVFIAAIGLGQHFLGWQFFEQVEPPAATFMNRNAAMHMVVLTFPLLWWRALTQQKAGRLRWLELGGLFLVVLYIIVAQVRMGWICVALQAIWLGAASIRRSGFSLNKALFAGAILVACLVALFTPPSADTYRDVLRYSYTERVAGLISDISAQQRFNLWENNWLLVKDHWFAGVGNNQWSVQYPGYSHVVNDDPVDFRSGYWHSLHSDNYQMLSELGLVGLTIFLLFCALLLHGLVCTALCYKSPKTRAFVLALALALFGLLANGLASFPLTRPVPTFFWGVLLGCVIVLAERKQNGRVTVLQSPPLRWALAIVALMLVLVSWYDFNRLRGQLAYIHTSRVMQSFPHAPVSAILPHLYLAHRSYSTPDVKLRLGGVYLAAGELDIARQLGEHAVTQEPFNLRGLLLLYKVGLSQGRYADAVSLARRMLAVDPFQDDFKLLFADASFLSGEPKVAYDAYRSIKARRKTIVGDSAWRFAALNLAYGEPGKSLYWAERALLSAPTNLQYLKLASRAAGATGNEKKHRFYGNLAKAVAKSQQ